MRESLERWVNLSLERYVVATLADRRLIDVLAQFPIKASDDTPGMACWRRTRALYATGVLRFID